jgi:photosystem II stability/assembly factor-like uncharacterized protein
MKYIVVLSLIFPAFASADWAPENTPTEKHLWSVAVDNQGVPWAVGSDGIILSRENDEWTIQPSPTGNTLFEITTDDSGNLWAVGRYGTIIKNSGAGFSNVSSPTDDDLWSVAFGDSIGIAVGLNGTIIKYEGGQWEEITSPTDWGLYCVDLVNDNAGWVVGANRIVISWDGISFSQDLSILPEPGLPINTVFCINENEAWAGGAVGKLYHYICDNWTEVFIDTYYGHHDFYFHSPNEGWVVGLYEQVYKYENGEWINVGPIHGPRATNYKGVDFNSAGVGWAVGSYGVIIRYSPTAVEPVSFGQLKALFSK